MQHAFAVKSFYKNSNSFVNIQHGFQRQFCIHCTHRVLSIYAINMLIQNVETPGYKLKKKYDNIKQCVHLRIQKQ